MMSPPVDATEKFQRDRRMERLADRETEIEGIGLIVIAQQNQFSEFQACQRPAYRTPYPLSCISYWVL